MGSRVRSPLGIGEPRVLPMSTRSIRNARKADVELRGREIRPKTIVYKAKADPRLHRRSNYYALECCGCDAFPIDLLIPQEHIGATAKPYGSRWPVDRIKLHKSVRLCEKSD